MLSLFVFLALFSIVVFCAEDFELPFPKAEDIPYVPIDFYKFSKDINVLDSGRPLETFDEVVLEDMLNNSKLCEVKSTLGADRAYLYTPALCTSVCTVKSDAIGTSVCKQSYSDRELCCPADKIPFYSTTFPRVSPKQREPDYKFHSFQLGVDWNKVTVEARQDTYHPKGFDLYNEREFIIELQKETLCGIKRTSGKDYALFFCILAESCSAPRDGSDSGPFIAEPSWTEFCYIGIANYNNLQYRCCHTNYFPKYHFSREYTNLVFQKIPPFLKYAVGLRSNFMCEAYSRFVCGSSADECSAIENTSPRTPGIPDRIHLGDAPYIARLGIVAPHVLIFHCLGAIVSHRYILSVWDCRQQHGIDTNIVIIGEDDTDDLYLERTTKQEQIYMISKIVRFKHDNDQPTLYRTTKDMQFSPRTRPACLYYRPMERPEEADLPYFGKLRNDEWRGRFLRRQKVKLHRKLEEAEYVGFCKESEFFQLDNLNKKYKKHGVDVNWEFCGGQVFVDGHKNGPCKYDRGSPVVVKTDQPYCSFLLLGVLTTERWNCEQNTPQVFSNTSKLMFLMEDVLWPQPFLEVDMPQRSCEFPANAPWAKATYWKGFWKTR